MTLSFLDKFHHAQEQTYATALKEIRNGRKTSHWMWFIFPQVRSLGHSEMAQRYAIKDLNETILYLADPVLGKRLLEITNALLELKTTSASMIMGSPDDLKLRSSATLFSQVPNAPAAFQKILDKFYMGKPDTKTLELLGR